jgi:micrococcal nuclease
MLLVLSIVGISIIGFIGLLFLLRQSNKPLEDDNIIERAFSRSFRGVVNKVSDGDNIIIQRKASKVTVRLWAIDTPEVDQPYGEEATKFVTLMCLNKEVMITPLSQNDLYGRTIGLVTLDKSIRLNEELVRRGLAWWYQSLAKNRTDYKLLEEEARKAKRGLWADKNPTPPWTWRKQQKKVWERVINWVKSKDCYYN